MEFVISIHLDGGHSITLVYKDGPKSDHHYERLVKAANDIRRGNILPGYVVQEFGDTEGKLVAVDVAAIVAIERVMRATS